MSPRVSLLLALGGLVFAPVAALAGSPGALQITLDQAKVAKLPAGATTLVVGNPAIADVTMLKSGVGMVVTGKSYGETNLIALDAQGNIIDEKQIDVEPTRSVLVVQRGAERVSYWCNPTCMPTVQLGDDNKAFSEASGQIGARNSLAQGAQGK
ncbi:MAG: pilus assembly protein N-terminal domain-containing protein [Hyphomicrobiales bacterium]|nr:pilus assembly protein N-terminal domain-containing protein [Hyphomicrobiales bacterium]